MFTTKCKNRAETVGGGIYSETKTLVGSIFLNRPAQFDRINQLNSIAQWTGSATNPQEEFKMRKKTLQFGGRNA